MTTTTATTATGPSLEPRIQLFITSPDDESAVTFAHAVSKSLADIFDLKDVSIRSIHRLLWFGSATTTTNSSLDLQEDDYRRPILDVILGEISPQESNQLRRLSWRPLLILDSSATATQTATESSWEIAKWCSLASPSSVRKTVKQYWSQQRQAQVVQDAQLHTQSPRYQQAIATAYDSETCITGDKIVISSSSSSSSSINKVVGKVRNIYRSTQQTNNVLALVTTDRMSGFDRHLAMVPYKGAVLNLTSAYWFEQTKHIIPNHVVAVPHPYITIAKQCQPFPIEFVVRSYMTGSTSTSIWKNYQDGVRNYCGHVLPEGMTKNQKLWSNLVTPTTKDDVHDRPISPADIVQEGFMNAQDWETCSKAALEIFQLGQDLAAQRGLILVDTKYEFGKDVVTGQIVLIDEVHTPDSSRYWLASTYEQRIQQGQEPDNIDKEFLRLWFRDHCDPYNDSTLPDAPKDLVVELARRYITLYEMITGKDFEFDTCGSEEDMGRIIDKYLVGSDAN